jgi:hypothetical protein
MWEDQIAERVAYICSSTVTNDVLVNAEGVDVLVSDCMLPAALFAGEMKGIPTVALVHTLYKWYAEGINDVNLFDEPMRPFVKEARP